VCGLFTAVISSFLGLCEEYGFVREGREMYRITWFQRFPNTATLVVLPLDTSPEEPC
jgi:hypothetical protein